MNTFERFLEDKFIDTREFCGRAITKDNCEDLFVPWLEDLDPQEFIDFANEFTQKKVIEAKEIMLKGFEPTVSLLDNLKARVEDLKNPLSMLGK